MSYVLLAEVFAFIGLFLSLYVFSSLKALSQVHGAMIDHVKSKICEGSYEPRKARIFTRSD